MNKLAKYGIARHSSRFNPSAQNVSATKGKISIITQIFCDNLTNFFPVSPQLAVMFLIFNSSAIKLIF